MMTSEQRLFADLAVLGIDYQLFEHDPVFTVEESASLHREITGAHAKNLFLKDKDDRFWLVTVPANMRVDLKQLPAAIGCNRVSFAQPDQMQKLLGIKPGSVTPLAAISDLERRVTVVLDAGLCEAEKINVHPLRNTATLNLAVGDLQKLLEHWHHKPLIARIPSIA